MSVNHWIEQGLESAAKAADQFRIQYEEAVRLTGFHRVNGARQLIANAFVHGHGIEVGGGDRPFPVGKDATVIYGDIRDASNLKAYFKNDRVPENGFIDAETFEGIVPNSLDFILSAHVIEHLKNPFGSILEGLKRLKVGGVYVIVVPDKRMTFDRQREPTSFEHLMSDLHTGGEDTMPEAYLEHIRYVHTLFQPPIQADQEKSEVEKLLKAKMDCHVHCWTSETFSDHLDKLLKKKDAQVVFQSSIENEAAFVIKRTR